MAPSKSFFLRRPVMPSVAALGLYALIIANCYSPTSLRFEWRALDTPFYLGALLLLPALAFVTAARVSVSWHRLLIRLTASGAFAYAGLVTLLNLMFGVDVFPIEVATTGGNQIVASMVAGGAFGPHFTEFREQKRVLPGLIFVRTIGYSDAIGSVTFTVSSPGRVRATISGDTPMTSAVFEARVAPLAPW